MLVFSLTDRVSFREVPKLRNTILAVKDTPNVPLVLAGNKLDLVEDRQVQDFEAEEIAEKFSIPYFCTSAKTQVNVCEIFYQLVREIRKKTVKQLKKRSCTIL